MNFAPLRNRLRQAANLPLSQKLVLHVACRTLQYGFEQLASGEHHTLEVKIGDDFAELPREVAEDFWADAFGQSPEFDEQSRTSIPSPTTASGRSGGS